MATGGNRNVLNRETGADGHRDWSFGLFDCTHECGLCMSSSLRFDLVKFRSPAGCSAFWCPCVVYSKNKQRLDHLQNSGTPLPDGGESRNADCLMYACLNRRGFGWVLQVC